MPNVEPDLALFASLVGQSFSVDAASRGTVVLSLTTVTPAHVTRPGGGEAGAGGRESFSLLFSGPAESYLDQATYPFTHPALGTHPIFIVPVGRDERGFLYEAVFN